MTSLSDAAPAVEHASAPEVRLAYANQVAISYSFYVVGATTAFVALALALSETEAGLHSSAMAVGMIVTGGAGERLDRLIGVRAAHLAGIGLLVASLLALAWAPALVATLAAALGVGLGAGTMFGHVNRSLGAGGGARARLQLTRSALVAKSSQLLVPVSIAVGAAVGIGWGFVIVPVIALAVVLFVAARSSGEGVAARPVALGRLPSAYWLPWILTVSVIGLEFFIVVWSGTLVGERTGVSLSDATLTISAFIVGMMAGRAALSIESLSRLDPALVIRGGLLATTAAVLVLWVSTSWLVSAGAMLVAGVGVGILYPVCAALTLAAAPGQPEAASARLVLAAGLAILVAPLLLGVVADLAGISVAWLLIPLVGVGVLALSVPVAPRRGAAVGAS